MHYLVPLRQQLTRGTAIYAALSRTGRRASLGQEFISFYQPTRSAGRHGNLRQLKTWTRTDVFETQSCVGPHEPAGERPASLTSRTRRRSNTRATASGRPRYRTGEAVPDRGDRSRRTSPTVRNNTGSFGPIRITARMARLPLLSRRPSRSSTCKATACSPE